MLNVCYTPVYAAQDTHTCCALTPHVHMEFACDMSRAASCGVPCTTTCHPSSLHPFQTSSSLLLPGTSTAHHIHNTLAPDSGQTTTLTHEHLKQHPHHEQPHDTAIGTSSTAALLQRHATPSLVTPTPAQDQLPAGPDGSLLLLLLLDALRAAEAAVELPAVRTMAQHRHSPVTASLS